MSNNRFWALVLLHMSLILHHVCGSGMWRTHASSPSGGTLPGYIVPDIEIYKPTCGWKFILKSSDLLVEIDTVNTIPEKVDDHTFLIENESYNKDLRYNPPELPMTLKGDLGNTNPVITVNWYCICNETTANNCERVPEPDSTTSSTTHGISSSSDTTHSSSTTPTTFTEVTSVAVSSQEKYDSTPSSDYTTHGISSSSDTTHSSSTTPTTFTEVTSVAVSSQKEYDPIPSNDTRLHLEKQDNLCYTGTYSELFNMRGLLDCGRCCLENMRCLGVNYWASSAVCNVVYDDTDSNSNLMREKPGCEYYKVIGRGD